MDAQNIFLINKILKMFSLAPYCRVCAFQGLMEMNLVTAGISLSFFQSLLGVSYSLLACALWPMVAFVVPEHQLGTAYGLYVPFSDSDMTHVVSAHRLNTDAHPSCH